MAIFNGSTLQITLNAPTAGVLNVNVQEDLYSEWKIWVATGDNSKFLSAFRTIGGDPLTPGVEAGAYFFLQNQNGWRIISSDADQTINYNGNLVGEDATLPLIVPTPGRTVLHLGLQPVTQRVDEILTQAQISSYNGKVVIDTSTSNIGTNYPVGTSAFPVNNVTDAFLILDSLGLSTIGVRGPITLNRDAIGYSFTGETAVDHDILNLNGYDVNFSRFKGLQLNGAFSGSVEALRCGLNNLLGLNGFFRNSGFLGNLSISDNSVCVFDSCFSKQPGNSAPSISIGADSDVNFRNYSGGLILQNIGSADVAGGTMVSLDLDPGKVTLENSCVDGDVLVRGVGELIDQSGVGCNVTSLGLLDTREMFVLAQSAAGNADISGDDLVVTILDRDATTTLRAFSVSADQRTRRIL